MRKLSTKEQIQQLESQSQTLFYAVVIAAMGGLGGVGFGLVLALKDELDAALVALCIGILCGVSLVFFLPVAKRIDEKLAELQRIVEREEADAEYALFSSGEWEFPVQDFYAKCQAAGVKDLDNSFYFQKAMALAKSFLNEEYYDLYVTEAQVKAYFATAANAAAAEQQRKDEWNRVPHRGSPDKKQEAEITTAEQVWPLCGLEKRRTMLKKQIEYHHKTAQEYDEKARKNTEVAASFRKSVPTEKPRDWASIGGAVSAIAGPAAGVAAAAEAMAENVEIERRNQAKIQQVNAGANVIDQLSRDAEHSARRCREAAAREEAELATLNEKIVLEGISSETLKGALHTSSPLIEKLDNNILAISLDVANKYAPDVPDGVEIVTDGVLLAEIRAGETVVGKAYIPLPMYGIPCGKKGTCTAFCEYYMETPQDYTLKIIDHNLWAMEA